MFRRRTYPEDEVVEEREHGGDVHDGQDVSPSDVARSITGVIASLIIVTLLIVEVLLGARLGFQVGEANPQNNFVEFVYDLSGPLVEPFSDIMSVETLDEGGVFDPNILIAMGVYLIAGLLALAVLWAFVGPLLSGHRTSTHDSRQMHQH
jgi:YGGT family